VGPGVLRECREVDHREAPMCNGERSEPWNERAQGSGERRSPDVSSEQREDEVQQRSALLADSNHGHSAPLRSL